MWLTCPIVTCPEKCSHNFIATISNVTTSFDDNPKNNGFPFCSGKSGKVCIHLSFGRLFPNIASELHPTKNKNINVNSLLPNSHKILYFLCPIKFECGCEHCYPAHVSHRTRTKNPTNCPFCTHKQFCIHTSLMTTHPEISSEWDYELNDNLLPSEFSYGSRKIINWICPNDITHKYSLAIRDRTLDNRGCKNCYGTTEAILNKSLLTIKNITTNNPIKIKWCCSFEWCKNPTTGNKLKFDFLVLDFNVLIELDGEQHFNDVKHFNSFVENQQLNDVYKMICAIENGYSVIRLIQMDVKKNKNDWKNKLINLLQNITIKIPTIHYIDNKNMYDNYKKKYKEMLNIKN